LFEIKYCAFLYYFASDFLRFFGCCVFLNCKRFLRKSQSASFWRSATSASCPHAASMSEPFSRRSVQETPPDFSALKNALRLSAEGLFQPSPITVLYGIKFTWAFSDFAICARFFASEKESFTLSIKMYSRVIMRPFDCANFFAAGIPQDWELFARLRRKNVAC